MGADERPTLAELWARAEAALRDGHDLRRETQELLTQGEGLRRQIHAALDAWRIANGRPQDRRG
jgi:hypothetical protein